MGESTLETSKSLWYWGKSAESMVVNLGHGDSFTIQLICPDLPTDNLWQSCTKRHVWFEVENKRGEKVNRIFDEVLPTESSVRELVPPKDPTTFQVLLRKIQANEFVIQQMNDSYSGLKVMVPGRYSLRVNVHCYDSNNRLVFRGRTASVELNLRHATIEKLASDQGSVPISLLVAPENGAH